MKKNTTLMFGAFEPNLSDNELFPFYRAYMKNVFKNLDEERNNYLIEKWNFMRNFFEAEFINEEIDKVNIEFNHKNYLQKRKVYYDNNIEKLRQQKRELYAKNKEKMHEKEKLYRETHKEELNEKYKRYYEQHKEAINARRKEKVTCDECGAIVSKHYLNRHKQYHIKHQNKIK